MAGASYTFDWDSGHHVEDQMIEVAQLALIQTAVDVAIFAKIDPPYKTGRYKNSIKVAEPGYDGDDFEEATNADLLITDTRWLLDHISDNSLEVGSYLPYSYLIQITARDPGKRNNILQAVEAQGTQQHYEYNFYRIAQDNGL